MSKNVKAGSMSSYRHATDQSRTPQRQHKFSPNGQRSHNGPSRIIDNMDGSVPDGSQGINRKKSYRVYPGSQYPMSPAEYHPQPPQRAFENGGSYGHERSQGYRHQGHPNGHRTSQRNTIPIIAPSDPEMLYQQWMDQGRSIDVPPYHDDDRHHYRQHQHQRQRQHQHRHRQRHQHQQQHISFPIEQTHYSNQAGSQLYYPSEVQLQAQEDQHSMRIFQDEQAHTFSSFTSFLQELVEMDERKRSGLFLLEGAPVSEIEKISHEFCDHFVKLFSLDNGHLLVSLELLDDVQDPNMMRKHEFRPFKDSVYYIQNPSKVYARIGPKFIQFASVKEKWDYFFQKYGFFSSSREGNDLCIEADPIFMKGLVSQIPLKIEAGKLYIIGSITDDFYGYNRLVSDDEEDSHEEETAGMKRWSYSRVDAANTDTARRHLEQQMALPKRAMKTITLNHDIDSRSLLEQIDDTLVSAEAEYTSSIESISTGKTLIVVSDDEEVEEIETKISCHDANLGKKHSQKRERNNKRTFTETFSLSNKSDGDDNDDNNDNDNDDNDNDDNDNDDNDNDDNDDNDDNEDDEMDDFSVKKKEQTLSGNQDSSKENQEMEDPQKIEELQASEKLHEIDEPEEVHELQETIGSRDTIVPMGTGEPQDIEGSDVESPTVSSQILTQLDSEIRTLIPKEEKEPQIVIKDCDASELSVKNVPSTFFFIDYDKGKCEIDPELLCRAYAHRMTADGKVRFRGIYYTPDNAHRVCVWMKAKKDIVEALKFLHSFDFEGGVVVVTLCDDVIAKIFREGAQKFKDEVKKMKLQPEEVQEISD